MDKYQGYRFPFFRAEKDVITNATSQDLQVGPVPSGRIWVITNLSIEDETTAFTNVRIGIKTGNEVHWYQEDYSLLAARLYWFAGELWLFEGQTLVARFYGCTAADVIRFNVNGFNMIQPESKDVPG